MDKKIVSLLNSNLRVIIPDFGAFIIRQNEPRIVVFNELHKSNDGLLMDYIMKTEGVETEVAEQLLNDFISHASRVIDSGNTFSIEGLGSLQKEKTGKIVFTPEEAVSVSDGILEISTQESIKPEKKKPASKRSGRPASTRKATVKKPKAAPSVTLPKAETVVTKPAVEEVEKVQPVIQPIYQPLVSHPEIRLIRPKQQTLFSSPVVRWLIAILAINLAVIIFFFVKDNIRNKVPGSNAPAIILESEPAGLLRQSVMDQLADSIKAAAEDTSMVFGEGTIVPLSTDASFAEDGNVRYYIVAGCFRDEVNANELVNSLKNMGYNAEKFGKIGDLYAVSFASFNDKELAVKELAKIREEFHPDAWMTRF